MPIGLHRSVVLCATYMHTCAYIYIYIYIHIYIYILCTLRYIYIYVYMYEVNDYLPEIVTVSWHKGRALHDHFATLGSARARVGIFCGSWLCRCLGTQWCVSLPMGVMGKSWSSWTIDLCGYGSIPINTIFRGMNIHLPVILMFTRYQGFDPSPCDLGGRTLSGYVREVSRTPLF